MDLRKIAGEHTIDVDLLPEAPLVLDIGCRDFQFDREILALRPAAKIVALDPDPEIEKPADLHIVFIRAALTDKPTPHVWWQGPGDGSYIAVPAGEKDSGFGWPVTPNAVKVQNLSLEQIRGTFAEFFDLVKLDCEGSEFGILENLDRPIGKQLSVEFHDWMNRDRWNDAYFEKLFKGPLAAYDVVLWGLTPLGPGNSMGHWDTLLSLKRT